MFPVTKSSSKSKDRRQNEVVHHDHDWCRFWIESQSLETKRLTWAKRVAWHGEHLKGQDRQLHSVGLVGLKAVLRVGSFRSSELPTQSIAFDCYCNERLREHWGWFWKDLYFSWSCKKWTMLWTVAACRDEVANTATVQTQDNAAGKPAILWHSVLHSEH